MLHVRDPFYKESTGIEETTLHVMRDCKSAKHIWMQLLKTSVTKLFFEVNLEDWLSLNMQSNLGWEEESWQAIWATTCH